jgi:hypothetical protein
MGSEILLYCFWSGHVNEIKEYITGSRDVLRGIVVKRGGILNGG